MQLQELLECLTADGLISLSAPLYPSYPFGGFGADASALNAEGERLRKKVFPHF